MKFRWFIVFMLFMAGVISYLDRAALSVAAPMIAADLNLNPAELGIVFSSFFFGYALFCFIGGQAADRFGPKRVLMTSVSVWSVFCGLTAIVFSLPSLLIVRVIFGAGEGPLATNTNKIISNWFEKKLQVTAFGFANTGLQVGGAVAGPVVGLLAIAHGWRLSFIIIGLLGMAWVVFWYLFVTDKPQDNRWSQGYHPVTTDVEEHRESIATTDMAEKVPLMQYLISPTVLATSLAYFAYAYILYFFISWFPSYLVTARHLSMTSMSFVNVIPWVFGAFGIALGGLLSDALARLLGNALQSRKVVITGGMLVAAVCIALAGMAETVTLAVTLVATTTFFMNLTLSAYWGVILDTVPSSRTGGVGGFMHLLANTGGIVAPTVTGFSIQWTGVFDSAFYVSGGIALLGAAAVWFFVRPIDRKEASGAIDQASRFAGSSSKDEVRQRV